jgi:hypothetical protein
MSLKYPSFRERLDRLERHLRNLADFDDDFNDKLNQLCTRISQIEETIKDWRENGVEKPEPPKSSPYGKLCYSARWTREGKLISVVFTNEHDVHVPITSALLAHLCYCNNELAKDTSP